MFSGLADAVDALDIAPRGDEIETVLRLLDRAHAKVAAAVGEFDHNAMFVLDAATSTTAWLRDHAGMTAGAAGSLAKTGARMRALPVTAAAWADGTLSGGQVQAIVANVDNKTIDLLAAHETDLVPVLAPLDVGDTATAMRHWKADADALVGRPNPDTDGRAHLSRILDGRWRLDANLSVEGGAVVSTALRLAQSPDAEGENRSAAQQRHDALLDVCRFFLDHQQHAPKNRNRPHVSVVVDWDTYTHSSDPSSASGSGSGGHLPDGSPVSPATIRRVLCDAGISRVVTTGGSVILDMGTTTRLFSDTQFHALVLRDRHCRHPGCDRPPEWCQAHHVIPWEQGGTTDLANGVLKCTRHHHIGHQPGWTETLHPNGTLHLTAPDGRTFTTTPPGVLTHRLAA